MFIHFAAKDNSGLHNVKTNSANGLVLRRPNEFRRNGKIVRPPLPGYDGGKRQNDYFDREVERMNKKAAAAQQSVDTPSSGDSDNQSPVSKFLRLWKYPF